MEYDTKPLQIQENKFRSHWNCSAPNMAKTNCWTFSSLPVPQTQSLIAVPRCGESNSVAQEGLQSSTQNLEDTSVQTFQLSQLKRTKTPSDDRVSTTTEKPESVTVKASPASTTKRPPKYESRMLLSSQNKSQLSIEDDRLANSKRTRGGAHYIDAPTPLLKALFDCDLNKARDLLRSNPGCVFDKDTKCSHSALLFACETDNALPIVKTMIETLGADVQVECRRGILPLTAALHNYRSFPTPFNKELIDYIMERTTRMDPNASPPCDTPLFAAVRLGDVELVKAVLKKGANANLAIEGNRTALHRVTSATVARVLIQNGACLDRQDSDGMTPLCSAALSGHVEVVRCLLEHKANPYICSHLGNPPIVCAAQGGHTEVVFLLHRLGGVPLGSETRDYEATALHYAAKGNHLDLVTRLVGHKGVSIDAKTSAGLTPLFIAAKEGHVAVVKLLLKKGANPLASDGSNALQMAKENGRTELYQELMNNKRMKKALKAKKHKDSIRKMFQKVVTL